MERPNRFMARVRISDGSEVLVHVASSGRMADLLVPGAEVLVRLDEGKPGRRTAGLLLMARSGGTWVSVDTSLPGRLLRQAFVAGILPAFSGYTQIRPEVPYGESRIDFLLSAPKRQPCLVEVKSVTSVLPDADGVRIARFPDAPTTRGARHLQELMRALGEGYRAAVCFIVQREDADGFGPYDGIDPEFGAALRTATRAGVEIYPWRTHVSPSGVALGEPIPLRL